MSFYTNYLRAFRAFLFDTRGKVAAKGVPGFASVWTGYYISAKGCRIGKVNGENNALSEGDQYGTITLSQFLVGTARSRGFTNIPFWSAVGWNDANGFKRFSLIVSWIFSIPFLIASAVLWCIGFLPVALQYAKLWVESRFSNHNVYEDDKLAARKHWAVRAWASLFMIPQLILTGIYRNVFDYSGKNPHQQIVLTFLVLSCVFIPSFHLTVGTALSGVSISGIALGGLPAILILGGAALVGLGLYWILNKSENETLEELRLEQKEFRIAEKEFYAVENKMVDILRLSGNQKREFIKKINNVLRGLTENNLNSMNPSKLRKNFKDGFWDQFDPSSIGVIDSLFVVLLQKEINRRKFVQNNKAIYRLGYGARSYMPWIINLGILSFALGLMGAIFLAPSISVALLSAILPYTLPMLVVSTLIFGFFTYMKASSGFFTATPQRVLFGLLTVAVVLLLLASIMPPFTALIGSLFSKQYNFVFIFSVFTTLAAIVTVLFYKAKIDVYEKEIYPDERRLRVGGGENACYVFRRVGSPYSKEVYYEKIGVEIFKQIEDKTQVIYRLKKIDADKYQLAMIKRGKVVGVATRRGDELQSSPYSFSKKLFSQATHYKGEYKALTDLRNSEGQESTLIMDGTLTQIEIKGKNGKQNITVSCSVEGAFVVSGHSKPFLSRETVKAYLKEQGYEGAEGMEKIQTLGRYQARIVTFDVDGADKHITLSDNKTCLFCGAGKDPIEYDDEQPLAKLGKGVPWPHESKSELRKSKFSPKFHGGSSAHAASGMSSDAVDNSRGSVEVSSLSSRSS